MTETPDAIDPPLVTPCDVPEDVAAALDADPSVRGEFATLPPEQRRGWVAHVESAPDASARVERIHALVTGIPKLPPAEDAAA